MLMRKKGAKPKYGVTAVSANEDAQVEDVQIGTVGACKLKPIYDVAANNRIWSLG